MKSYLVVFQLRFRPFSIRSTRAHQSSAALTFQLNDNGADINALRASHNNPAANLIKVGERHIARLVKDDGSLH